MLPRDKQELHPAAPHLYHHFQTGEKCLVSSEIFKGQVNIQLTVLSRYSKLPSGQVPSSSGGIKCMFMDTCYHYRHFPIQKTWSFTKLKSKQCLRRNLLQLLVIIESVPKWRAASLLLVPHQTSSICWGHWLSNCAFWLAGRTTQGWLKLPGLQFTKGFICIYSTDSCNDLRSLLTLN